MNENNLEAKIIKMEKDIQLLTKTLNYQENRLENEKTDRKEQLEAIREFIERSKQNTEERIERSAKYTEERIEWAREYAERSLEFHKTVTETEAQRVRWSLAGIAIILIVIVFVLRLHIDR